MMEMPPPLYSRLIAPPSHLSNRSTGLSPWLRGIRTLIFGIVAMTNWAPSMTKLPPRVPHVPPLTERGGHPVPSPVVDPVLSLSKEEARSRERRCRGIESVSSNFGGN